MFHFVNQPGANIKSFLFEVVFFFLDKRLCVLLIYSNGYSSFYE